MTKPSPKDAIAMPVNQEMLPLEQPELVRTLYGANGFDRQAALDAQIGRCLATIRDDHEPPFYEFPLSEASCASLLTPAEERQLLNELLQLWMDPNLGNPNAIPDQNVDLEANLQISNIARPSDKKLIKFIRDYIGNPVDPEGGGFGQYSMRMHVPRLSFNGFSGGSVKFSLNRYEESNFISLANGQKHWDTKNVKKFLRYLIYGAHFVTISSEQDLKEFQTIMRLENNQNIEENQEFYFPINFCKSFRSIMGKDSSDALCHSHYSTLKVSVDNIFSGLTFPSTIQSDDIPDDCPIFCAFLTDNTVSEDGMFSTKDIRKINSFFQLEGWPAMLKYGQKHGQDFEVHKATKWNISTYGASIFSEKRGTTIFLAPPAWKPSPKYPTIMAPYAGATPQQGWLDTKLICCGLMLI